MSQEFSVPPPSAASASSSVLSQSFVVPPLAVPPASLAARPNKARRMLEKLFPEAQRYVPRKGSYSAMPWVFRRAASLFNVREWQVLTYLYLRSGPESLVWMSDKQMAIDFGIGPRKVGPHIRSLVAKGFLSAVEHDGTRYLLLLDPEAALRGMAARGAVPPRVLGLLADDFETLGLAPLTAQPLAAVEGEV
jgi:hypothetical protein